jgi:3-oxoisoapionate decarboxylase
VNPGGGPLARHRVGLDAYSLHPLHLDPLALLQRAVELGAGGVQFSGFPPEVQSTLTAERLREIRQAAGERGLYLEWGGGQHIPRAMGTWAQVDIAAANRTAVEQAVAVGARVIRSCSGGLMRWDPAAPPTEVFVRETIAALRPLRSLLRDHGVVLAIETHFEFTSFELLRILEGCEAEPGDWLGICLDTMNLLTMLEDPIRASRRLLPWVVATHIKDGGLLLAAEGMTSFPAGIGEGVVDLGGIIAMLDELPRPIALTIEDHGGEFSLPIHDGRFLSQFPNLTVAELAELIRLAQATLERPRCRPMAREDWPGRCAARVAADIAALKAIVASIEGPPYSQE